MAYTKSQDNYSYLYTKYLKVTANAKIAQQTFSMMFLFKKI